MRLSVSLLDFLGNIRKKYTDESLYKIIDRMEKKNIDFKSTAIDTYLIDLFVKENIDLNYGLIQWIDSIVDDTATKKAIATRIKSAWIKKDAIDNTKKYKTNIKKFVTWLKKQRGEI